ncbi:MAG: PAS domain-containing protein [Brevundimonas diminuta]|nr:PAS domain-containing protein [Brevundimonas diminuta]
MDLRKLAKTIDLVAAFDSSPNPYMLLDRDLRFAGMNQAYLDVTQRRRDDLIGHHVMEMFAPGDAPDSEEESRRLRASFDKVLATGEPDHLAVLHYPVLTPGPDGEPVFDDRFWSCTHTPIKNEDGQVTHILQHTSDVTELLRLRQKTGDGAGQSSALDAMVGDEVFRRAVKIEANNQRLEAERKQLTDMLMNAPGFVALNDVYETGEPVYGRQRAFALRHAQDGPLDHRYIDFAYQPIRGDEGKIVGIFVQGHDVTDVVLAAERQKLMIDELNHRVKNTLATVQSIAMQTARTHQDPGSFAAAFQSRILALSHTHDLLTRSHWEGADLRAVLEHETQAHGIGRLTMNGPHVALSPARAVSLGMIFHELATNAAKYGALACGDGRVMVDWAISDQKSPRLHITWREAGGEPIPEPERRGFGTRLIERNVRHDLHGTVQLSYPPEGFCAEISLPLETETL